MEIKKYCKSDESRLFDMLVEEGPDWSVYHDLNNRDQYIKALASSITYIVCDEMRVYGYIRCRDDDGFGVYVYDLLVRKADRGKQLGKLLMEWVCHEYPTQTVYVMSDVDAYYEKLGYRKEGSIFEIKT